jgi:hypothetical protein
VSSVREENIGSGTHNDMSLSLLYHIWQESLSGVVVGFDVDIVGSRDM